MVTLAEEGEGDRILRGGTQCSQTTTTTIASNDDDDDVDDEDDDDVDDDDDDDDSTNGSSSGSGSGQRCDKMYTFRFHSTLGTASHLTELCSLLLHLNQRSVSRCPIRHESSGFSFLLHLLSVACQSANLLSNRISVSFTAGRDESQMKSCSKAKRTMSAFDESSTTEKILQEISGYREVE
ncbi:hypothetical protein V1478_003417 [Vespula squamosa]|uniref:Uncharacterized protein n=1 Tax=Vespula squamosa TaxID=30214 RepID=A0ABD2BLR5_VESSQ